MNSVQAVGAHVRDVDVADAAVRRLLRPSAGSPRPSRSSGGPPRSRSGWTTTSRAPAVAGLPFTRRVTVRRLPRRPALPRRADRSREEAVRLVLRRQVVAVDGEEVVAGRHLHARLRERRAARLDPVLPGEDSGDLPAPRLRVEHEVGAERPDRHPLRLRVVAAADVGVPRAELAPPSRRGRSSGRSRCETWATSGS